MGGMSESSASCLRCYGNYGWTGLHGVWEPCPDCDPIYDGDDDQ